MFLGIRKVGNNRYLYLLESVYNKKTGKHSNKIVESYGNYDDLPEEVRKNYEDKKKRKELTRKLAEEHLKKNLEIVGQAAKTIEQPKPQEDKGSNFNRFFALNYGHLALKPIWEKDLGMKYKVEYLQNRETSIQSWRLNDLLFYLCSLKLIDPKSYLSASTHKGNFFYCPWHNIVQDNFYRGLDFVYEHREQLIEHAVKRHQGQTGSQIKVAFFDCTNMWFETPYDDPTWQAIRFARNMVKDLEKQSYSQEQIRAYLDSDEFAKLLAEELQLRESEILRVRGQSKEGRYTQPIVTVALAIDQSGFPIDCKVYAGNLSEIHTVEPMIESLREKYAVKDIYFVADKGLNSAEKLEKIKADKLGFVVAQSVSRQKKAIREQMLDINGYRNYQVGDDGKIAISVADSVDPSKARFKVCNHTKNYETANPLADQKGQPKKLKHSIQCKIIYTFSANRRERELRELDRQILKAQQAVNDGKLLGNPYGGGWRALLTTKKEAAQNKQDKEQYRACGLKRDIIEERRRIAGYSALVFNHPESKEAQLSDTEVLSTYHRLVNIEECFRMMKGSFSIRPVYVRLREHIIAHCYLCVLSLMLMRCLQEKLENKGHNLSCQQISSALAQALLVPMPSSKDKPENWLNVGFGTDFYSPLYTGKKDRQADVDDLENHLQTWENYRKQHTTTPFDTDLIIEAVGLKNLPLFGTTWQIKKNLKINTVADSSMVAPEYLHLYEQVVKNSKKSW